MLGYPPTEGVFKKVTVYAKHSQGWTRPPPGFPRSNMELDICEIKVFEKMAF